MEKSFFEYITGGHPLSFHLAGLVFAIVFGLFIKRAFWYFHKKECRALGHDHSFNGWKAITQNWPDFILSLFVSWVIVVTIDYWLHIKEVNDVKFFGYDIPVSDEPLVYYPLVSAMLQILFHKVFKPYRK